MTSASIRQRNAIWNSTRAAQLQNFNSISIKHKNISYIKLQIFVYKITIFDSKILYIGKTQTTM